MDEKKINFPDRKSTISNTRKISNFNTIDEETITKITTNVSNYLNYLADNNLLPELPSELKIVYVKDNSFFTLDKNKKSINNVSSNPPDNYLYPACMSPTSNTLYLSNDLELDSNIISNLWNKTLKVLNPSKSNAVLNYRDLFNQDNQKALEYIVGHEFGHFFLQLKNKDKNLLTKDKIIEKIALNIEEAFSESFSLHIMCLKNKGIELETNQFEKVHQYRLDTEKHRLRFFKQNPTEKDITQYQQYFKENGIDKLLGDYDFPLIYKTIPFKDNNGNLETDINKIYDKCYQLSLDNNRETIKNILSNEIFQKYRLTKVFSNEMEKSLNIMGENKTIDEIITLTHKELEEMSFSTKKILGLRDKFLNPFNNTNQIQPTI